MAAIDWDWPAQLETCQNRIAELEKKVASQKVKINRLVEQKLPATSAQLLLAIWEESLTRVRDYKRLIETRLADRAAGQHSSVVDETKEPSELIG